MKKINFNIIYYFCLAIFILSSLFRTMQQIFDPLEIVAYVLLIIKIIKDNIEEFKDWKNINKRKILINLGILILFGIAFFFSRDVTLVKFILLIYAFKGVSFHNCVKVDLYVRAIGVITVLLLCKVGIIEDVLVTRGEIVRHSLGFYHPNVFGDNVVLLFFEYIYLQIYDKETSWKNIITYSAIGIALSIITYFVSNTRSAILAIFMILMGIIVKKCNIIEKLKNNKTIKFIITNIFIILEIFTIIITISYYNNNFIGNIVNKMFSLRLYYNVQFFEHFGITPFGVNFNGFSNSEMTLDMAYSNILIRYGIFFTIFLCIIFKKLLKYLYNNKNYILLVIFLIFITNGLFENLWLRIEHNIFMLILYPVVEQYINQRKSGKQKEDERVQENFTQN